MSSTPLARARGPCGGRRPGAGRDRGGAALAVDGRGSALASPTPAHSTPIKHLVVIFQENVSFDHYFGTYPSAANTSGQPFYAKPGTPTVNGLSTACSRPTPTA